MQSLISGRIEGVPAFWNAEGVVLRERGVPIHEFRADAYGAPRYPEVVLVNTSLGETGTPLRASELGPERGFYLRRGQEATVRQSLDRLKAGRGDE